MTASFEIEAHDGVITLPERVRECFNGKLLVTVTTVAADESRDTDSKQDFIDFLINNPVEPFTPLTREEANDRYY